MADSPIMAPGRVLHLQAVPNARQLGGLATHDDRRVASNRLFRTGTLHRMTESDRVTLSDMGVGTVIDLRSDWERGNEPYRWPEVEIISAPLVSDDLVSSIHARFATGDLSDAELIDWWGLTRVPLALETHLYSMKTIFETLLGTPADQGVLYHCSGGKDRTGVVSAVVLEALGVVRADIAADFIATNDSGPDETGDRFIARLEAARGSRLSREALASITGVKTEWLDGLFALIAERYQSVDGYLVDRVGLGESDLLTLRNRYLEP